MLQFVIRRLLAGVVLIAVVCSAAYLLLYLGSGNIARGLLGNGASEATVAAKAHALGLDRPLEVRFIEWASNAIHGDFGESWLSNQPVATLVSSRLSVTLTLVLGAMIVSTILAVVLGVLAARRGGWIDRVVQILAILGFAIPGFLVAIVLVNVFAINLHWFKPTGYVPIVKSFAGWTGSVTLPIVALSIGAIGAVAQQVRGSVLDAQRQDWVRTLRSRGLSERRVVFRHVLRNAGGPALAVLALQFVGLVGGTVIIEQMFAIPGIGEISVSATATGDIPVVMGIVVVTAVLVVVVNLAIDILQGFLNPKARLA